MDQMINLPPTPSPVQEVAPKGHVFIKVLLVVLVLGLLGGGGAFAYFKYFAESPEMKIYKSFANTETINTYSLDFKLTAKGKILNRAEKSLNQGLAGIGGTAEVSGTDGEQKAETEITFTMKGDADISDTKNPKTQSTMTIGGKQGEKEVGPLSIDYVNDSKVIAIRFPKIPVVKDLDLSEMNNQWISYDYSKFKEKIDALVEQQRNTANKKFTDEDKARLMALAKQAVLQKSPITVTQTFKKEVIGGVETQPYAFTLSKENLIYLVETLAQDEKAGIKPSDIKQLKEILSDVQKLDGTVWVGGAPMLPYKLSLSGVFQDPDTKDDVTVSLSYAISGVNKPVSIVPPTNAMSFEDAFSKVMAKMMEASMAKMAEEQSAMTFDDPYAQLEGHGYVLQDDGNNIVIKYKGENGRILAESIHRANVPAGISLDYDSDGLENIIERLFKTDANKGDTDGDGLSDGEEVNIYKTHPGYKDTDEDGYTDGEEVKTNHDPLKK